MAGLLGLPSELLYTIIDYSLTIPVSFLDNKSRYRPSLGRGVYCLPSPGVKKIAKPMSLLLTNRRISLETTLYLSKSNKSQNVGLDIAIVDDHWIWPTARRLPVWKPNTVLDKVEIDLLPCCTQDERYLQTGGHEYAARDFCEAASSLVALLYSFLEHKKVDSYVEHALCDFLAHPSPDQLIVRSDMIRINTLIIRINTTRYGDGNRLLSGTEVPHRRIQGLAHLDFDHLYSVGPEKAERYLAATKDYIDKWMGSSSMEIASIRVGKILFCIDDAVWKEVSMKR